MSEILSAQALSALFQVIMIDLVLAGDNAIVIGLAAAGLPKQQRNKAILIGIMAATVLRILFAGLTTQLLQVVGLLLAGGILLLWVCWKMWRELRTTHHEERDATDALADEHVGGGGAVAGGPPRKTFAQAAWQIVVADVSMSLDNVLAVAGAAREHLWVLIVGLLLAGGILLLWVCWKMWRELRTTHAEEHAAEEALEGHDLNQDGSVASGAPRKTFAQAAWQIIIADVSMSLDNVLAVAGAAREHPYILAFGLLLSIALMGIAASFIARLLQRHRWIAYVGLAVILYVAIEMIYRGAMEVAPVVAN